MKTKIKSVFYCEWCKRHGLSAYHMQHHELHCTANPNRECRMCGWKGGMEATIKEMEYQMRHEAIASPTVEQIVEEVENCPACALTVIRALEKRGMTALTKKRETYDYRLAVKDWWVEQNRTSDFWPRS